MQSREKKPYKERILVVDDQPDNVQLLRDRLEARGYEVTAARDGEEALESVLLNPPDLILLDVMMPKMDGMEVVKRLKTNPDLPFIPVIMQTALEEVENKIEGLEAGADDYITKPINFPELDARVRSLLRIKALQEDLSAREKELSEINAKLRHMSQTDALTSVDNRRYLEERLHEMFAHSERLNEHLAVLMCDIDHFKKVNDTYGHQAGDEVLRKFAEVLKGAAREIDRVGRYGGEEFVLLLPGTDAEEAMILAERLREDVSSCKFTFDGGEISRTMSCGVASFPHPLIKNEDQLIKAADDALYVAKETGRNRVVKFEASSNTNSHEHSRATSGTAA